MNCPTGTFKALAGNLGSLFLVCNLILTRLEEKRRKTSWAEQSHTRDLLWDFLKSFPKSPSFKKILKFKDLISGC